MGQSRWNPGRWGAGCWQSRWLLGSHGDRAGGSDEAQTWWGSAEQLWLGAAGPSDPASCKGQKEACDMATQQAPPLSLLPGIHTTVSDLTEPLALGSPGTPYLDPRQRPAAPRTQSGTRWAGWDHAWVGRGKHGRGGRRGAGAGDEALRRIRGIPFLCSCFLLWKIPNTCRRSRTFIGHLLCTRH